MLSLSGMSGSTGSGIAGVSGGGGVALQSMETAALGRHLAALREKLDDVCDEIVLVKVVTVARRQHILYALAVAYRTSQRSHLFCCTMFARPQSCSYISPTSADGAPLSSFSVWEEIVPQRYAITLQHRLWPAS